MTFTEYVYYRGAKIVKIADILGDRMNTTNPEYPCLHCGHPIMDHDVIDVDSCTLKGTMTFG